MSCKDVAPRAKWLSSISRFTARNRIIVPVAALRALPATAGRARRSIYTMYCCDAKSQNIKDFLNNTRRRCRNI